MRDRQNRYWLTIVFFGFFILVMLVNAVGYVFWDSNEFISGFWFTTMVLGFGLANMASMIHKSKPAGEENAREEANRDKRLNRWFVVFILLAIAWFVADRALLPQMGAERATALSSMLAGFWLVLASLTYLFYVVGYTKK